MRLRGCLKRPSPGGGLSRIFTGRLGVRAGWRVLLFLSLAAVLFFIAGAVFGACTAHLPLVDLSSPYRPWLVGAEELLLLFPALGASSAMAFLEGCRLTDFGLRPGQATVFMVSGLAFGVLALASLVLWLAVEGDGKAGWGGLGLAQNLRFGVEWLAVSLLIGLAEEFICRGYLLKTLAEGAGFPVAAVLTSLCFAAMHIGNAGESFIGLSDVLISGATFCVAIWYTKSLWWVIGYHGGWDYAENFLFGTRDSGVSCFGTLLVFSPRGPALLSGGDTGPEGSVFILGADAIALLLIWWGFSRWNRTRNGVRSSVF